MNIPNPFKLLDFALLDYVFNPIAWASEYRLGRDAADLSTYSYFAAIALLVAGAIIMLDPMMFVLSGIIAFSQYRPNETIRYNYRRNTKTGLNRCREIWWARMMVLGIILTIIVFVNVAAIPSENLDEDFGALVSGCGFACLLTLPNYFETTDALPPGYGQKEPEFG